MNVSAVAYYRVSGKSQVDGDGFPRQQEAVERFCMANRLNTLKEFRELGVSGTVEGVDRPAFSDMLAYMGDNGVTVIVVERMDRLARDLMVQELLLRECRKHGIAVYSADQGHLIDMASDGGDPTRKLIRQIMGALAEWEKSQLVSKLRAARERTGRLGGRRRFGSIQEEKFVVDMMKEWRSEGRSDFDIAKSLTELGIPTASGAPQWRHETVKRVLSRVK